MSEKNISNILFQIDVSTVIIMITVDVSTVIIIIKLRVY
jgi:hypothetical protein